jgi:uncharacterized protein (DUF1330 family)
MEGHVVPPRDVAAAFAGTQDDGGPIVMLNLLRYRDAADYSGHPEASACSGREAYRRYAREVFPLLKSVGAELQLSGAWEATVIGTPGERWDDLLIVRYPSRSAFIGMLTSAAYQKMAIHRTAALSDSRLIAFKPDRTVFNS